MDRYFSRIQSVANAGLTRFIEGPLDRALRISVDQPLIVLAGAVGALVLCVSLIPAGIIPTTLADSVEGDFATVSFVLPDGATAATTYEVAGSVETVGHRAIARISEDHNRDMSGLLSGVTITVGTGPRVEGGGLDPAPTLRPQANIATVEFKLIPAEERHVTTGEMVQAWRKEVGTLPNVKGITFSGDIIDLGNQIEVVLSHPDPERLVVIAESVVNGLRGLQGVHDIRSDHTQGIPEVQLSLKPHARTLGPRTEDLARQARAAFFGTEARRLQRGQEEVSVYVRLP